MLLCCMSFAISYEIILDDYPSKWQLLTEDPNRISPRFENQRLLKGMDLCY